ncbi:hypothetical protein FOZ60_011733 [Perkinsus olseni]|uniref:Uncharacterized protein n=1 Tax=Perkinsus olseni TaxID=32597 RepID=A0A7J6NCM5_PEROL|nr:hypothetical protein FOZ60_011733 [Perkinsus olseni]
MHIQCVVDRHADAWFKALTKLLSGNGSSHTLKEEEDNPNQTTTSSSPHADTTSDADTGEILTEESYEVVDESNADDDDSEDYTISNTNIEYTMMSSNTMHDGDDDEDESSDDDDGTSSEGEEGHYDDDDDDDDDDDSLSIQTEISLLKSIVMQRDDIIQNMQSEGTRSRCVLLEEQNNLLLRLLQEREDTLEDVFNLCELLLTLHDDPAAGSGGDDDDTQKRGLQSSPPLPPLIPLYQLNGRKMYGFDSFKGLPSDWVPQQGAMPETAKGSFAQTKLPEMPDNVELVVGMFDDTLPDFAQQHINDTIALLHNDSVMYESTVSIFKNLGHMIVPGTIIVMDELFDYPQYADHELKGFFEFLVARSKVIGEDCKFEWIGTGDVLLEDCFTDPKYEYGIYVDPTGAKLVSQDINLLMRCGIRMSKV